MEKSKIKSQKYCDQYTPPSKQGETGVFRHPQSCQESELPWKVYDDCITLADIFKKTHKAHPDVNFLGQRNKKNNNQYEYQTYAQVYQNCIDLGSGIQNLNLAPPVTGFKDYSNNFVGIMCQNRTEWLTLDLSNILYKRCMVPFYDVYKTDVIQYIVERTQLQTLFCTKSCIDRLIPLKGSTLKNIVLIEDDCDEITKNQVMEAGFSIQTYAQVMKNGKDNPVPVAENIDATEVWTLCFTSGTTGMPKAVMLDHKMVSCFIYSILFSNVGDITTPGVGDLVLSYLPLTHVYERYIEMSMMACGATVAYFQGDVLKLKEDLADCKPTIFCSVPRLYNRFYGKVQDNVKSLKGCKRCLADKGIASKTANLQNKVYKSGLWDPIIFKKMAAVMGGRVRMMTTGSAPIDNKVFDFMRIMACAPMQEGYGQTESGGASFITRLHETQRGHVGGIVKTQEFKLEDIPDMNYLSTDVNKDGELTPRGEVCLKGPAMFKDYYKDEEKTKEAIDSDGWLHTGDVGMMLPNGALKVIDRKKNLFKLSQGEYVAPEKIENIIGRAKGVAECFVDGKSTEAFLVAIIVPSFEICQIIAQELSIEITEQDYCQKPEIQKAILDNIVNLSKAENLSRLETVNKIKLEPNSFQGRCLTPTFKLQRHKAREIFANEIDEMYKE